MNPYFLNVLITGASSGLGAALARECAGPGVTLHLSGRDIERLGVVADECRARGAGVRPVVIDVCDAPTMAEWIAGCGRLDLVICNAGVGAGTGDAWESADDARRVFDTNITGVLNTALPAIEVMATQEPARDGFRGHVAVVASLAAFIAGPSAPAYAASKAAVQRWAEARDGTERKRGIRMHSICPGFVRTPMTAKNPFPMPLLMDADEAARRTMAGLQVGKLRIVYPRRIYWLARAVGALPPGLLNRLLGAAPPKPKA